MADLDSDKKSDRNDEISGEDTDKEREVQAALASSIWKGEDISNLRSFSKSQNDLVSADYGSLVIIGLDAYSADSAHHAAPEADALEKNAEGGPLAEDSKATLEKKYGVEVREKNGRYEYVLKANGKDTVLFDSDKSTDGLNDAEKKLNDAAEARMRDIEEKYGIKITREGQEVSGVGHGEERDKKLHGRTPTLKELTALEEALKRSGDTRVTKDPNKPLEVTFVKEEEGPFGFYNADSNHLFMFTSAPGRNKVPPTAEDREGERSPTDPPDLKLIILHELAHHSQMSFPPDEQTRSKEYRDMGWVESKDKEADGAPKYELLGKDGYQYEVKPGKDGYMWYRKDSEGNYIDKDGNRVDNIEQAHSMSVIEMRKQALVPPATDYFLHPIEQQGDNLALLRSGGDTTGQFIRDNYDLYVSTRATDQRHIDSVFGKNLDGTSKMIRLPDGTIAENNQRNQDKLRMFEQRWNNMT